MIDNKLLTLKQWHALRDYIQSEVDMLRLCTSKGRFHDPIEVKRTQQKRDRAEINAQKALVGSSS